MQVKHKIALVYFLLLFIGNLCSGMNMFDNSVNKREFNCSSKMQVKLHKFIADSVTNTLLANRIPENVASKLTKQIVTNINLVEIYKFIGQDIQDQRFPKQRILDRTIVHMFEKLYRIINAKKMQSEDLSQKEFFNLVPRGECLDLFLQLVKEYCMGDAEIEKHTYKIAPIIDVYRADNIILWPELYESDEFKIYLEQMLELILSRLRTDKKPIPALENKIPIKYQPYRINEFLKQVCYFWKHEQIEGGN